MPTRVAETEPEGHAHKRLKGEASSLPEGQDAGGLDAIFHKLPGLLDVDVQKKLHAQFTLQDMSGSAVGHAAGARVDYRPFPSMQIRDVLTPTLAEAVQQQLMTKVSFAPKENDLYSYRGSGDLADDEVCPPGSPLARLRDALYSEEFTNFISASTGVRLFPNRPDLSSHQYHDGDHLLAHDDDVQGELDLENEGRRIAFILYFVDPKWAEADGGSLDLYECDKLGHPTRIAKSIKPIFNSIALFEVTPTSYHQVAEVTLPNPSARNPAYRLSISGWFHGPLTHRLALPANIPLYKPGPDASSLITATYLDESTHESIQSNLITDSSIELRGFLKDEVWTQLEEEIKRTDFDLTAKTVVGPSHLRHFYSLHGNGNTPILNQVTDFLRSAEFLALLSKFTSLEFGKDTKGRVRSRLFKKGCYTLLHDQGHDPDGVDVILSLGTKKVAGQRRGKQSQINGNGKGKGKATSDDDEDDIAETGWSAKWGGQIHYAANRGGEEAAAEVEEEDDAGALTLSTRPNTLAIMVRNINTLKYVKYVNDSARDPEDGSPLARLDIEALYEVEVGGDEGESVEGEIVEDEEDEVGGESGHGDEAAGEDEEWVGIVRKASTVEPDGPDELDDE